MAAPPVDIKLPGRLGSPRENCVPIRVPTRGWSRRWPRSGSKSARRRFRSAAATPPRPRCGATTSPPPGAAWSSASSSATPPALLGPHPFSRGLNDCTTALEWMDAQRDALGLTSIAVTGESGGGNLSLATSHKGKRDGHLDRIDGVYAQVPFIYGAYDTPDPALPSLVETMGTSSVRRL